MRQLKILFTCVGRRVELIQAFSETAVQLAINLTIWGSDADPSAPALFYCDRQVQVSSINDRNYIPELLSICKNEKIDAVIPTIDTDIPILSKNKDMFLDVGTRVVVSSEKNIQICQDKRKTVEFFKSCNLNTPHTVDDVKDYSLGFPCFIKPIDGSSSINAFKINNQNGLEYHAGMISDYVIQPFISGKEYTIDAFCDFEGNPIFITPRERLAVRGGEVLRTKIVQDQRMIKECMQIINTFKPCGAITVQLIRSQKNDNDYFIEINPRFGGGAPLSMKAGANAADALLRLLFGERVEYQSNIAAHGTVYSRYDQSICTSGETGAIMAIIFDLDDTLYSERDYVRSGFRAVAEMLPQIENVYVKLMDAFSRGFPAIDYVLGNEHISDNVIKQECLKRYRNHSPDIRIYPGVTELLQNLRERGIKLGLLTDGRPEGQWTKINALGLCDMVDHILVTDELGGAQFRKPNDIAFRIMQQRMQVPFTQMMYVGDNASKDFIAPQKLKMKSLWFNNPDGLYYKENLKPLVECICINNLKELFTNISTM